MGHCGKPDDKGFSGSQRFDQLPMSSQRDHKFYHATATPPLVLGGQQHGVLHALPSLYMCLWARNDVPWRWAYILWMWAYAPKVFSSLSRAAAAATAAASPYCALNGLWSQCWRITSRHEKPAQAPLSPLDVIHHQGKCQLVPAVLDCLLQGQQGAWIRPPSLLSLCGI